MGRGDPDSGVKAPVVASILKPATYAFPAAAYRKLPEGSMAIGACTPTGPKEFGGVEKGEPATGVSAPEFWSIVNA